MSVVERRHSNCKTQIAKDVFVQQDRKKRRMHSNSILHELRLSEKINLEDFIVDSNPKSIVDAQRNSSIRINTKKKFTSKRSSLLVQYTQQKSSNLSNSCQPSKFCPSQKQNLLKPSFKKKKKKFLKSNILGGINSKIKQISIISKTFDKVNQKYSIRENNESEYKLKPTPTEIILKQFQKKLNLRKNIISERRNSLKKNAQMQYRYRANPKRYLTQADDTHNQNSNNNYRCIWNQDARKMKNYINGGYLDERQDISQICNIEEFRNLKKNFSTFQQICNNIKQDKDNPIGKISQIQYQNPNLIQIVYLMERYDEQAAL